MRDVVMQIEGADTFLVLDVDSGNVVAYFEALAPAESLMYEVAEHDARRVEQLALVACDKRGMALDSVLGIDFLKSRF